MSYLKRLRMADNEEVYRGFASVLSDLCGWADDLPDYAYLEKQELSLKETTFRRFIQRATGV